MNDAHFSGCSRYRHWLLRELSGQVDRLRTVCLWIMLNPSTADCTINDPTIKRCMGFTAQWGYDDMEVVNLFDYRATDPKMLLTHASEVLSEANDVYIRTRAASADRIVCAWGSHKFAFNRSQEVLRSLRPFYSTKMVCLGRTVSGAPKHPLYLKGSTLLESYG